VDAARCRWVQVWTTGGDALADLAHKYSAAQDAFRQLMESPKRNERFQTIYCLRPGMPKSLLQELLYRGLNDRSKRVRTRAAQNCDTLLLREMLPELCRRAAIESDPEVKRALE